MKIRFLTSAIGASMALAASASGATYSPDFAGLAQGQVLAPQPGSPYDGWIQSEANFSNAFPLAYGQAVGPNSTRGVAVGGYYATPDNLGFNIQHTIGLPFAGSDVEATFTVGRIPMSGSNPNNIFEIGTYTSGGANLFSLVLRPNPNDTNVWDMKYRLGAGVETSLSNSYAITLDQIVSMGLTFTANSGNSALTDVHLNLDGITFFDQQAVNLGNPAQLDRFRIAMLPLNPVTQVYGSTFIAVVPEPSSAALLGLTAVAVLRRRRRC